MANSSSAPKGHATPKREVQRDLHKKRVVEAMERDPNLRALYELFSLGGKGHDDGGGKARRFSSQAGWSGGKNPKGRTGRKGAPRWPH